MSYQVHFDRTPSSTLQNSVWTDVEVTSRHPRFFWHERRAIKRGMGLFLLYKGLHERFELTNTSLHVTISAKLERQSISPFNEKNEKRWVGSNEPIQE